MNAAQATTLLRNTLGQPREWVQGMWWPFREILERGEWRCFVGEPPHRTVLIFAMRGRALILDAVYPPGSKPGLAEAWSTNPITILTEDERGRLIRLLTAATIQVPPSAPRAHIDLAHGAPSLHDALNSISQP